jgi:hypothetical protein
LVGIQQTTIRINQKHNNIEDVPTENPIEPFPLVLDSYMCAPSSPCYEKSENPSGFATVGSRETVRDDPALRILIRTEGRAGGGWGREGGRDDGELIKSCSKREKRFDALLLYVYTHAACVNRKWRPEKKSTCGTCIRKIMGCTGSRKPPSPRNANREIVSSATQLAGM